jgi:hypothetical protein
MKIPHYGGSFLAELENEGVVTSAAQHERCPVVGHKGVVGRTAPDIMACMSQSGRGCRISFNICSSGSVIAVNSQTMKW